MEKNREAIQPKEQTVPVPGGAKCPFCPCWFVSAKDLEIHMKAFGNDKGSHYHKYLRIHNLPSVHYSTEQRESWEKLHEENKGKLHTLKS